jgi:hypothetical protein
MSNILEAILNIATLPILEVQKLTFGNNRATNVGEGLEIFIKDAFSDNLTTANANDRLLKYADTFSYEGSATRPPDLMLRGGDAIEVKKTESVFSDLQLNSSHPKAKLFSNSSLINNHCRTCEEWVEKDIIYTVGHIQTGTRVLSSLWFVYGSIYAADEEVYTDLKHVLTESLENAPGVNFSETNELGRVNYVDPLKITNMRIRGMWLLQPPVKVYDYIYQYNPALKFQLVAIIPSAKFQSMPLESRNRFTESLDERLSIRDVQVKNPNNIVNLLPCKLITLNIPNE